MDDHNTIIIVAVIAAILFILVVILFMGCWYFRKRRQQKRNEMMMEFTSGPSGSSERTKLISPGSQTNRKQDQTEAQSMLLMGQFYVRTIGNYKFSSPLPQLGSAVDKYWFLINPVSENTASSNNTTASLLTMQPKSERLNRLNDKNSANAYGKALNNLFNRLYHPYVEPMTKVDVLYDQKLVVKITPFQREGSLKDLIEKVIPTLAYEGKYSNTCTGLSLDHVRLFATQILEGLLFLQSKSIPPMIDLHSGNIIVVGTCAQIGSYEYQFLEQRSRIYSLVRRATASVNLANGMTRAQACEVYCFGGIVFEMLTGYELGEDLREIRPENWNDCARDLGARDMLARLFDKSEPILTLSEIRDLPYFSKKPVQLKELRNFKTVPGDYSNDVRKLLELWTDTMKKKRASTATTSDPTRRASAATTRAPPPSTPIIDLQYTPIVPSTPKASSNPPNSPPPAPAPAATPKTPPPASTPTVSKVSTPSPPPPAPPPPPPAPPAAAPPAPPNPSGGDSGDRSALLDSIRLGARLKKTVTNDRSTPKFK